MYWAIFFNNENLQRAWGRENGVGISTELKWRLRMHKGIVPYLSRETGREWLYDILEAQVRTYKPDVLYCMATEAIGSDFLDRVRGSYRLAIGQHASPLPKHDISEYDLILSSLPNQVEYFQRQGMKSVFFRLGFEPRILTRFPVDRKRFDTVFVGGLSAHHQVGTQILESLCQRYDVKVWGYGIENLGKDSQIRKVYMGPAWGSEMYQILSDANIVFNRHIDVAEDYANNMRLFEATGVGTFLVTDWKENLAELFEPDKEVVAYRSPEECVELIQHYLDHDEDREAIARAGQKRTLSEHTWHHRMQELVDIVHRYL